MKLFRKNLYIFLLLIMGTFLIDIDSVEATNVNWKGVVLECIYSDGGLYEYSYNDYTSQYSTNRYSYSLKGVDSSKSNTTSSIIYSSSTTYGNPAYTSGNLKKCKDYIYVATSTSDEDEDNTTVTYIKFSTSDLGDSPFTDTDFGETWYNSFWKKLTGTATADKANSTAIEYDLVSENYILTDAAGEPNSVYSYKKESYKEEGEVTQAVSTGTYLTILKYDNAYFVQGSNKTTAIDSFQKTNVKCFNDASAKSYSGNSSTVSYYFDAIRYKVSSASGENGKICDSGERYVYSGTVTEGDDVDTGELCTKIMPQTAQDLATIIGWVQILVPILLIILVGLDIGKIVVAGNIEDDLPKQKKKIIVRFIVAISVFFLPLIMKLLLSMVKVDSGSSDAEISTIQYIQCIFDMV